MQNKYPEYIMQKLRESLGLEPTETYRDAEINLMSSNWAFDSLLEW